jgi:hypothetical protein
MKYCHSCGKEWISGAKYCGHCGAKTVSANVRPESNGEKMDEKWAQDRINHSVENSAVNVKSSKTKSGDKRVPSKKKKLFLSCAILSIGIGGTSFFFLQNSNKQEISSEARETYEAYKEVQEYVDETGNREEFERQIAKESTESPDSEASWGNLNGFWYNADYDHFVSFTILDDQSGEFTLHDLEENYTYSILESGNSGGLIDVVVTGSVSDNGSLDFEGFNVSFYDKDTIEIDDGGEVRVFERSSEEALFNHYSEYEAEQLEGDS